MTSSKNGVIFQKGGFDVPIMTSSTQNQFFLVNTNPQAQFVVFGEHQSASPICCLGVRKGDIFAPSPRKMRWSDTPCNTGLSYQFALPFSYQIEFCESLLYKNTYIIALAGNLGPQLCFFLLSNGLYNACYQI